MFNVKWACFPAGAAFLLALLVSLVGPHGFGQALLHGLVFGALFFGIGCGAWVLVSTQLPELLNAGGSGGAADSIFPADFAGQSPMETPAGSAINITLGDGPESAALPGDMYGIDGIGNIADLVPKPTDTDLGFGLEPENAGDIDQTPKNGYNTEPGVFDFAPDTSETSDASGLENSGLGDFSSFFDGMTAKGGGDSDDSMADFFQSLSSGSHAGSDENPPVERERKTAGAKPVEMQGDFSPKEIAMGIRTALAKEKRG